MTESEAYKAMLDGAKAACDEFRSEITQLRAELAEEREHHANTEMLNGVDRGVIEDLRNELAEWKVYGKDKADQLVKEQVAHMEERELSDRLAWCMELAVATFKPYDRFRVDVEAMMEMEAALTTHSTRRNK